MDLERFRQAKLTLRESTLAVPQLAEFFGEEKPKWRVRGLEAKELGRCDEAATRGLENIKAMISAMAGEGDKAESIRKTMGLSSNDVPTDVSRRIEMLMIGSVSPVLGDANRDIAVKIAEKYPGVFYQLTNEITNLTGRGAELGKPKRSGKAEKSKAS